MSKKFLCWLDFDFTIFGMVKALQEKTDSDFFVVIDAYEKMKKFFQNQKFINFKKTWYFYDHITDLEEPDIDYLIAFEKKYKINLWKVAFSERAFYKSFNPYYKFNDYEILSILEKECKFFESMLDEVKPDYLLIRLADWHYLQLLCELCFVKGIRVTIPAIAKFGNRTLFGENLFRSDSIEDLPQENNDSIKTIEEWQKYLKKFDAAKAHKYFKSEFNRSNKNRLKASFDFFARTNLDQHRKKFTSFGRTKSQVIMNEPKLMLKRKIRQRFLDKNCIKKISEDTPFVYFPFHYEPERVLLIGNPFYTNQIEVAKNIAKSLPINYKLFVKDHPAMTVAGWRPISHYKQLIELPNVELVHPEVLGEDVMKKCDLVISISGTSGFEAAFYKKPAVVFEDSYLSHLPFVYKLKNLEELPIAIKSSLDKKVDETLFSKSVSSLINNSIEVDWAGLIDEVWKRFYYSGFLTDVEIQDSKMKSFLKDYDSEFLILASEYLKKIEKPPFTIINRK